MAKNKSALSMVPAKPGSLTISASKFAAPAAIPKGLKKLTLPPLLKPDSIPFGQMVHGKIVALVGSISPKVKEGKLIHLLHEESGSEFLLPLTGVIKQSIGGFDGVTANIGKTLYVVRQADGETDKYMTKEEIAAGAPKKPVYMFDVYLKD